jgi:hypothetical protein
MPALLYLYQMLHTFRHLFARHLPWATFCGVILGFMGSHHIEALTSICRFWQMDEIGYHRLLHFFHSSLGVSMPWWRTGAAWLWTNR